MSVAGADDALRCPFLSNHFLVLLCVARDPDVRVRDIAPAVGITERATQAILADLIDAGYLERTRIGRRSHYRVRRGTSLRQPLVAEHTVGFEKLAKTVEQLAVLPVEMRKIVARLAKDLAATSRAAA